jgi:hypothetical protein
MDGMRKILVLAFILLLAWHGPVLAQTFRPIDNPEKFAEDLVQAIANGASNDAASAIVGVLGQPELLTNIHNSFRIFDGKKFDFTKKVIDNEIGGALRQIVDYAYIEQLGFIYFRFNFKMTSKGWILANFKFKSETQELLPKDF